MIRVSPLLSCSPRKREIYAVDPYFRDAWDDIVALWGAEDAPRRLFDLASAVFRPDALVVRGVRRGVDAIRELGFVPLATTTFRYDRLSVREGWRYQLNIATRERIDVMDMIMPATDSLYVLMRRISGDTKVPASTQLSSQKGPSLPEHRQPHHLRALVGRPQVSVLTYLHIADEPADLVRELGVFFDRSQRAEILNAIDANEDASQRLGTVIDGLYASIREHPIDFKKALKRIEQNVLELQRSGNAECSATVSELIDLCERIRKGSSRDWQRLLVLVETLLIPVDHWERVALAATLAERHLDEADLIIPDISLADWLQTW
jgi:hypothetical protein